MANACMCIRRLPDGEAAKEPLIASDMPILICEPKFRIVQTWLGQGWNWMVEPGMNAGEEPGSLGVVSVVL